MSVNLSILGLYNYDNSLFSDMALPEGVDREILANNILMECAELEALYSDPGFMKFAINQWSSKEIITWNSLKDTFELEYNPIWNVDGTETTILTKDLYGSNTNSENGVNTGSGNNTHQVNGFNEAGLKDADKDLSTTSMNTSVDNSGSYADKGTETTVHTRGGNIGVTMSQQLLEAELEVRPKLNIYNYIIESFKNRFCLLIY